MRLDWGAANRSQVPEFCVEPVTSSAIGGWLRCMGVCPARLQLGGFGCVLGRVPLVHGEGRDGKLLAAGLGRRYTVLGLVSQ